MKYKSVLIAVFMCSAILYAQQTVPSNSLLPASPVAEAEQQKAADAASQREEQLYKTGTDALNQSQWQEAAETFSQAAALNGRRADAALYWKAYALNKLGRHSSASATLADLRNQYPRSTWLKDAGALEVEIRQASRQPVNPEAENDEDLKLLALNSLMNSDPDRAIPLLQKFLSSNNSPKLKERAMFVLSQSDSPKAREVLLAIAHGQSGPELQLRAIQNLGIRGTRDVGTLQEIYVSATDPKVKRAVINAFMIAGAKENLLAVARQEQDPVLRKSAINQLGAMGARSELQQMYQSSNSPEEKSSIINALAITGDVATIAQIGKTASDSATRIKAIRALGIAGPNARPALLEIYNNEKDSAVRKAVAEGLFIQGDDHDLIELARKESDREMKKVLVQKLSLMDSKEARDYMLEILNK